jgi:hypothetical protein
VDRCHLAHAAEFLSISTKMVKFSEKVNATIQAVLVFFIVAHPLTFRFTDRWIGGMSSSSGTPTEMGLLVHSAVFGAIVFWLMGR